MSNKVCLYGGDDLARYSFGHGHPFGADRLEAFWNESAHHGLHERVCLCEPVKASEETLKRFHSSAYIERVKKQSLQGKGYLDNGDTPAFEGVFEAASFVVGTALDALDRLMDEICRYVFIPIGGLHHARRDSAGGFCVFNDCGVVIETLRAEYGIKRIGYVDIDAHHGDGVFYSFEDDKELFFVDIHEDGRYLYPGTGAIYEKGKGLASGTKLNIPLLPFSDDEKFFKIWPAAENFLKKAEPEFIIFQCGADGLADDPITHLNYSVKVHAYAAQSLCRIAQEFSKGRILALGGGGYNRDNVARAWTEVLKVFIEETSRVI
jgi:acetoin utilization protein AcuC